MRRVHYYIAAFAVIILLTHGASLMWLVIPIANADESKTVSKCLQGNDGFAKAAKGKVDEIKTSEDIIKLRQGYIDSNKPFIETNKDKYEKFKSDYDTATKDTSTEGKEKLKKLETENAPLAAHYTNEKIVVNQKESIEAAQKSTEFRRGQILQKYEKQIAGAQQKRKELTESPASGDDEYTPKLNAGKIKANIGSEKLLEAKCLAELCTAKKEDANSEKCKELKDLTEAAAAEVRKQMLELTYLEQQKNAEQKFSVTGPFTLGGNKDRKKLIDVTNKLADWMITLVGSLAVTALIIGGGMMIISGGDETRLETGKTIFTYSLIGLVVTLLAYGIVAFLQSLFY